MNKKSFNHISSRRKFIRLTGLGVGAGVLGLPQVACKGGQEATQPAIQGFEITPSERDPSEGWEPVSDRKIRVGLIGYGMSTFSAGFGFQNHPNVEIAAVSDLFPDRCAKLAERTGCKKTYPSGEELMKDETIEAVFVATDPPSHASLAMLALKHGKHVASAVPAVWGSLEEAEMLFEAVKRSGLNYMMFETSCFRANNYAMRQIYNAGGFGKIVYAEGEYWHYTDHAYSSYNGWRIGSPPQWYPTHSDAYYVGVTNGSFTEVSCIGVPSVMERYQNNKFNNPFGTEISFYRTSEGGSARMARCSVTPGHGAENGRVRGTRGSFYDKYEGLEKNLPDLNRPPIPSGVPAGYHGGSHGPLMNEFVLSILQNRKPLVDIAMSLNMTVGGIVAHQSALKGGEWLKIPQYKF